MGGLSLQVQAATLRRSPEAVVATPGRCIDHLRNTQSFGLEDLAVLVLDEADRLLEMGFKEEARGGLKRGVLEGWMGFGWGFGGISEGLRVSEG